MSTPISDDDIVSFGSWTLQTVIGAEADADAPFTVTLTFADGYCASVNLYDANAKNLGIVLNDVDLFPELRVDPELGTIAWPNGYDYDPDSLRMRAMEQHPDDVAAVPLPPPWCRS